MISTDYIYETFPWTIGKQPFSVEQGGLGIVQREKEIELVSVKKGQQNVDLTC